MNKVTLCGMCGKNYINADDDICLSCAEFDDSIADSIDEYLDLEELGSAGISDLSKGREWLKLILTDNAKQKNDVKWDKTAIIYEKENIYVKSKYW